jgi:hypothetical protein
MAGGERKYLVETSAVPAAIGASTAAHCRHYTEVVRDGRRWTSVYIRKEFIHAFFCELAYAAFYISQRTSVRDSLVLLANRFSIRSIKVDVIALGILLDQQKAMHNPSIAAEEIGSLAIRWLKTFDRLFRDKIPNQAGCLIGLKKPTIDYNTLLKDLNGFYEDFTEPVSDCPINDFVGIGSSEGGRPALLSEESVQKIDSIRQLTMLLEAGRRFVCDDCRKIGDTVIALEQPEDQCLLHLDNAYNKFCSILKREHKQIRSAIAIDGQGLGAER